jgi:hypothetical protein
MQHQFDNLLLSRMADDPGAVIINKARTLEQIEDYFSREGHKGFVLDRSSNEIIFRLRCRVTRIH